MYDDVHMLNHVSERHKLGSMDAQTLAQPLAELEAF